MSRSPFRILLALVVGLAALVAHARVPASAAGVDVGERAPLVFGTSTALSGPAGDLGREMRAGLLAAFAETNRDGGIRGHPLELLAYDDGYEPERTVPNMHRLIDEDEVLGVVGNVGSPTAVAALPLAREAHTPFLFAYTGVGALRGARPDPFVVNFRASYEQETAAIVDALVEEAGIEPEEIGFFTQRDAYGDAGLAGGIAALRRHGLSEDAHVPHGRYERNSIAVENGLAELLLARQPIEAVVMIGAYEPCARFVELAREAELDALLLNVSFVCATSLAAALGDKGDGVIVTQVVPHIDADLPIVGEYRAALEALEPEREPTFVSFEGYVAGRILCRALREHEGPLDRAGVLEALLALGEFDLGLGVPLRIDLRNRQASNSVWPTVLRGGEVLPFAWSRLRERREQ